MILQSQLVERVVTKSDEKPLFIILKIKKTNTTLNQIFMAGPRQARPKACATPIT